MLLSRYLSMFKTSSVFESAIVFLVDHVIENIKLFTQRSLKYKNHMVQICVKLIFYTPLKCKVELEKLLKILLKQKSLV